MDSFQNVDITWSTISGGLNISDLNNIVPRHMERLYVKTE